MEIFIYSISLYDILYMPRGGIHMENLKNTIEIIVEKFPNYAVDVADSLEILSETINDIIDAINNDSAEAMKNRDYDYSREAMNYSFKEKIIRNLKNKFKITVYGQECPDIYL